MTKENDDPPKPKEKDKPKEHKPRCPICGKQGWCTCGYGPEHNHEPEP